MSEKIRLLLFGFLMFLSIVVDFRMMLMSVLTDAIFVIVAGIILWPILKKKE